MSSCFVLTIFFFGIGLCFASQLTDPGHTSFGALIETRLLIGAKSSIKSRRFLRPHDTPKQKNNIGSDNKIEGERAGVPGMTKIEELVPKLALKLEIDPTKVFKNVHVVKSGAKLDGNRSFLVWFLYVKQYRIKRGGDFFYGDDVLLDLLRKTKSEEELVRLFQSLRQNPAFKDIAEKMKIDMVLSSASSHRLVNAAWLNSRETPEEVFKILRLKNG
ncbi:RXLR phytopathogen effector protein WY-domain [Phytophthora infestans]|uniref:RXLR phytopathogen effector protein WY-domain n=1 Tax=Phytophthora infestans TaxID=4787 RepID=A0A8S9U152_PHYIN|nr:RXLR phytopathogen effector protein WY-domain [Phytophthora infestans]